MRILHLSADYPDPLAPAKTRAVSNLLELTPVFRHRVYSLNRVSGFGGVAALDFADGAGDAHRALAYKAPARGLFLKTMLDRLADWVIEDADKAGFKPDLIHAHKLSVEGLAGARIARRLGAPLAVSIQGNSDLKIVGARPDLRRDYRRIWREAAVAFPFAPWASRGLNDILGTRAGPVCALPCPGPADSRLDPRLVGPVFRTAFHLGGARGKNIDGLLRGVARAARAIPEIRLEVVGGGDPEAFSRIAALIGRIAPGRAALVGPRPNDAMQALFNASCAMPLISHRESFGMVFAEALRAGAPCLIPRGRAIDGYFEEGGVILAADPKDDAEIAEGLTRLAREEAAFKERLHRLAENGGLEFFSRKTIGDAYVAACSAAVAAV